METFRGFSEEEEKVLRYWQEIDAFNKGMERSKGKKEFSFYDGPPFATGLPHYGHILAGTIKDTVTRFFYQQGYHVERRFGWDCHGLPIEYEIDKIYGIKTKQDAERIGTAKYNKYCRKIVMKYSGEWEETVNRMGRWIDFGNSYKTMDFSFMESVWNVFKELYVKGLIYRGYKVMPYSVKCRTPMSNFEANQNYKETSDPAVTIRLPLKEQIEIAGHNYSASLLAWTTTPWTLPSNSALLVHPEMEYVLIQEKEDKYVIMALFAAKKKKYIDTFKGSALIGKEYLQPFPYFEKKRESGYFRVYAAEFVQEGAGTGIVHCAPGFGEEDYNAFVQNGLIKENEQVVCPVDEDGCFTEEVPEYKGVYVKDADKEIIAELKKKGLVYASGSIVHSYPFCWRSDTPLIYKAVPSWFVRVKDSTDQLIEQNKKIEWLPATIGTGKFGGWLKGARDWAISRNRYWGTPIPLWIREGKESNPAPEDIICIGSAEELEKLSKNSLGTQKITDIHKEHVDCIVIEKDEAKYRRVEEVLDCWFESGSVPYAQIHYPFENKERLSKIFPADFISEGVDQTRGWFYTLHVLSVLLHRQPAFKNVIVTGLVLAADGKKMSKRLKNYPDPSEVMKKHGADALRMYLLSSPVVKGEVLRFTEDGVIGIVREVLIPWKNCVNFLQSTRSAGGTGCEVEDIALGVCTLSMSPKNEDELLLDLWIIQELEEFLWYIQKEGKAFRLYGIIPRIISFLGDLSRWYIRLSRERLRNTEMPVLAFVLKGISVGMAPFAPFFSEKVYLEVVPVQEREESVHFVEMSSVLKECEKVKEMLKSKTETKSVLEEFRQAKSAIEAVRAIREKSGTPLRMPVKQVCIIGAKPSKALARVVIRECNAIEAVYKDESEFKWNETVSPNFRRLAAVYGGAEVQKRAAVIRKASKEEVRKIVEGSTEVDGVKIEKEDVVYKREIIGLKEGWVGASATDTVYVIVDITQDDIVQELWMRREVKSAVQRLRKKAGLRITDLALLYVQGVDPSYVTCDAHTRITTEEVEGVEEKMNIAEYSIRLKLGTG